MTTVRPGICENRKLQSMQYLYADSSEAHVCRHTGTVDVSAACSVMQFKSGALLPSVRPTAVSPRAMLMGEMFRIIARLCSWRVTGLKTGLGFPKEL
jgi:hypothetical protein